MRNLDFTSWQGLLSTLLIVTLITLVGVGIRLLVMQTIQQRRERGNRQINERLKTLIAAYKTLGGSFTGNLLVNPAHLRDLRQRTPQPPADGAAATAVEGAIVLPDEADTAGGQGSERARRIRDAVEAALSDVILLGTDEQVRLAAQAANDMVQGRPIRTAELVVSLRNFIREVLDLDAIPASVHIPSQGPVRPASGGGGRAAGGAGAGGRGGGGAGGGAGGGGMGLGMGAGMAANADNQQSV